jgi:ribosomal-protein-alanine N-acetyltransferase
MAIHLHHKPSPEDEPRLSPGEAPELALHNLAEDDIDVVMAVEKRCFTTNWSREALFNEIGNPCAYYVVAEHQGNVVGYAGEWIIMDEAHITTIAVAPEAQGKRFGERLLIALLREAMGRGARRATLEVRASNSVALRLYAKYGFETVAIRRKYYQDTDEDALIMWSNDLFEPGISWLLDQRFGDDGKRANEGLGDWETR